MTSSRWMTPWVMATGLLLASIATHRGASAQTAIATMMVQSEGGLCLAVARPSRNQAAASTEPALGWAVVAQPCTGARAQRFQQVYGDYDDFFFEPGLCLGQVAGSSRVELAPCDTARPVIESDGRGFDGTPAELRLGRGELCLTAPAAGSASPRVTLAACGSATGQRWRRSQPR